MISQRQALGLTLLLASNSQLRSDLNDALIAPNQDRDGFWKAFTGAVQPLGINEGDLDRSSLEPLWFDHGQLQSQVESDARTVGLALSPPLDYEPGPCPNGALQTEIMKRLA